MGALKQLAINAAVITAMMAISLFLDRYWVDVAILVAIYGGVASAWNIAGGFSGTFSFGHGLFFGIGAYGSTMLFTALGLSPWLGMLAGAALSGAAGALIARLAARGGVGDLAFAVLTLAIAEIAYVFTDSFEPLGASRGISIPPAANGPVNMQFTSDTAYGWVAIGFLILCQIVAWLIAESSLGFRFRAVRENPTAAQAMGIDPVRTRTLALGISGALTALGGVIYAQYLQFVNPLTFFGPVITIKVILFALIGGMGTIWGPVLGTALFFPPGEWLRDQFGSQLPGVDSLIYGALVVFFILGAPQGIVGTFGRRKKIGRRLLPSRGASSPAG